MADTTSAKADVRRVEGLATRVTKPINFGAAAIITSTSRPCKGVTVVRKAKAVITYKGLSICILTET